MLKSVFSIPYVYFLSEISWTKDHFDIASLVRTEQNVSYFATTTVPIFFGRYTL